MASILPNGRNTFYDANGAPLVGGKVFFYIPTTTTPKDTWQDAEQTILNTNPIILDDLGSALIYGTGVYRQILKDVDDVTIWDAITADAVSLNASWSGISGGAANAQTVTNANFSLEDGQQITFLAGIANTGPTTLNVSGTGAISVVADTSTGPQALGGGEITVGNVVSVVYETTTGVFHIVTPTPIQAFNGAVYFNGVITPTILAADQNDWAPTGGFAGANTVRASATTAINISGLDGGASGRTLFLQNIDSPTITLLADSSLSTAGNRFLTNAPTVLRQNDAVILQYDGQSSGWRVNSRQTSQPIAGGFKNLVIQNVTTSTTTLNTQSQITADQVTVEDSTGTASRLANVNVTVDITLSGAGGLDTGAVAASTAYFLWVIYNPSTNTVSGLYSRQSTLAALTLPSGYTFAARVGWNATDSSIWLQHIIQRGRRAQYVISAAGATTNWPGVASASTGGAVTLVSLALYVPTTAISAYVCLLSPTGTNSVGSNSLMNSAGPTSSPYAMIAMSSMNGIFASSIVMETPQTIYWASNAASTVLFLTGYEDNL